MGKNMTLQLARVAGDCVRQRSGHGRLKHGIAAFEPCAIERLKPRRTEGARRLVEPLE